MTTLTRVFIFGLAILLSLPVLAQSGLGLKGTLEGIPTAPEPKDQNGDPIKIPQRTPAEIEADRIAQNERVEQIQAEEKRLAEERQRQAELQRANERLAEEQQSRQWSNTMIFVLLAVVAVLFVSRFFKRRS